MAQTHTAYLETIDRSFRSLAAPSGGDPMTSDAGARAWQATPPAPVESQPMPPPPDSAWAGEWPATPAAPAAPALAAPAPAAPALAAPAPAAPAARPAREESVAPRPSVAPAPPLAAAPAVDLQALLLEVVAEKTGYPPEMLTMEMELEGDLGIDSIKRVEILAAMTERVPGLPEVDTAAMAKLATLAQVVDFMDRQQPRRAGERATRERATAAPDAAADGAEADSAGPGAPVAVAAGSGGSESSVDAVEPVLGRYVPTLVERPAIGMALHGLHGPGPIVVTDEGTGVAHHLVALLARRGVAAQVADEVLGDARGVVFLGGLREVADEAAAIAVDREAFAVARAVASRFERSEGGVFVTVQDTGGAFGAAVSGSAVSGSAVSGTAVSGAIASGAALSDAGARDGVRAWLAGCAALARSVAHEWPGVSVKAIDLERSGRSAEEIAAVLADELLHGGPDADVGLAASGRRAVLRSRRADVALGAPVLRDGDVVVASGGARGVTASSLIALAARARLRFVLLGRTPLEAESSWSSAIEGAPALQRALLERATSCGERPTPVELGERALRILAAREVRATIAAIESAGSQARYECVDVTSEQAVATALERARVDWGPIAAVVHGAGVLADRRSSEKTAEQFARVFDTKAAGLRSLLAATAADPLRLLCLFSSIAASRGNAGQADYAMANEVLNKVAQAEARRRGPGCLVKALAWGPWDGGMVTAEIAERFAARGVPLLEVARGARAFVEELTDASRDQVEVVLQAEPAAFDLLSPDGRSECRTFAVEVAVGGESHPYLDDHAIRGRRVVPIALVVDWFCRTARAFGPELALARLRDLEVLRGITLGADGAGRERLVVRCRQLSNGRGATLSLELLDGRGGVAHRATAELVEHRGEPPRWNDGVESLALEPGDDRPVYDGGVLFHGPAFQSIRTVHGLSERGASAELRGVVDAGWTSDRSHRGTMLWGTDPLLLDGGLQLALVWCGRVLGGASLPTSIAEIRTWIDEPVAGPVRCTLRGRQARGAKGVCDVVLHAPDGRVLVELVGVETHRLQAAAPDHVEA
jgi:hypothetical protein